MREKYGKCVDVDMEMLMFGKMNFVKKNKLKTLFLTSTPTYNKAM
jgi:hypothetical protein